LGSSKAEAGRNWTSSEDLDLHVSVPGAERRAQFN
jgi:hypothetical protein